MRSKERSRNRKYNTEKKNSFVTGSLTTWDHFSTAAANGGAVSKQEAGEDGPGQAQ